MKFSPHSLAMRMELLSKQMESGSRQKPLFFGAKRESHWICTNAKRFEELLKHLPKTWSWGFPDGDRKAISEAVLTEHGRVSDVLLRLGKACPWTKFGDSSECYRPHVQRKLWMLMSAVAEIDEIDHEWRRWKASKILRIFPDVQGVLKNTPSHWQYNAKVYVRMSAHVPFTMHACWSCLFGYVVNPKYTGNSEEFCNWACKFIHEAAAEGEGFDFAENDDGQQVVKLTDLEFSQVVAMSKPELFERCRMALHAERAAPPTPLMVMRKCADVLHVLRGVPEEADEHDAEPEATNASADDAPKRKRKR